jgi:hypothetical protein
MSALAVAALAEAAYPYGIESFDTVVKPLWKGIRQQTGKALAAFLKAMGFIVPLMDAQYAFHFTREVRREGGERGGGGRGALFSFRAEIKRDKPRALHRSPSVTLRDSSAAGDAGARAVI